MVASRVFHKRVADEKRRTSLGAPLFFGLPRLLDGLFNPALQRRFWCCAVAV